ncbi:EAL domain-containing protein [Pseudanabaena sp. FACHB-2040]|uniref:EAL domain-containing protein n=1 Tax=Pseudanabaena sp. FACHB-2040 TaxID=2692859 RepID=UPI00168765D0|nr:EAL domain-containing protein [Pseudanabaena sp. FACHB-2040]MBD2260363.1 EAL domain-containing protein [Pseudanabaena sp. FACHB-2040]
MSSNSGRVILKVLWVLLLSLQGITLAAALSWLFLPQSQAAFAGVGLGHAIAASSICQVILGQILYRRYLNRLDPTHAAEDTPQHQPLDLTIQTAHHQIAQNQTQLADILNNTLACIAQYRLYPDNRFTYDFWSEGAESVFGFSAQAFRANPRLWFSRVLPEDIEAVVKPVWDVIKAGKTSYIEYRFCHQDGSLRWIASAATARWDEQAGCWVCTVIDTDISDRKALEIAVRHSQAQLSAILDDASTGIASFRLYADRTWEYDYSSAGHAHVFGFSRQELHADKTLWYSRVWPEDQAMLTGPLFEDLFQERACNVEFRFRHKNGSWRWISGSYTSRRDREADCWVIVNVSQDITARKQAEESLRCFERVFSATTDAIALVDRNFNFQLANQAYLDRFHLQPEEIIGHPAQEIIGEAVFKSTSERLKRCLAGEDLRFELWFEHPAVGREFNSVTYSPYRELDGTVSGVVVSIRNLTELRLAQEALWESEARFRLVAENMNDLVCLHDREGTFLYVSPSCRMLLGYEPEELVGTSPYDLIHREECDRVRETIHQPALQDVDSSITYRVRRKTGEYIWLETLTSSILNDTGQVIQIQTASRDVTEKIEIQNQLKYEALHDALTGLPNRNLLMERLALALERLQRQADFNFAVLFLDLDRFKVINDSLGHQVGDDLLLGIAQKLSALVRTVDLAARLSGDEFVVLLEDIEGVGDAVRIAERVLHDLQQPFTLQGREVFVSTSIGIVIGSPRYQQGDELLRDADIAMYRAKANGKACYAIFDPQMHLQVLREMDLENALRLALEQQQFILHYQPVVSLKTGRVESFEALVRWHHPQQGLIYPGEFIPLAEETGLIVPLGNWILREACRQLSLWQAQHPLAKALTLSINLSPRQLKDPNLVTELEAVLMATAISPQCLTLEITENVLIEDIEHTINVLAAIRAHGVGLSIDDFGTGYSSLSYLHRFPFTALKIDQSFVSQLGQQRENPGIVRTMVALADSLGLNAIAEGIETDHQLTFLQDLHCECGQGYLFSRPLTTPQVEALLAAELHLPPKPAG